MKPALIVIQINILMVPDVIELLPGFLEGLPCKHRATIQTLFEGVDIHLDMTG